jgi:hypothetical protein
MIKPLDLPVGAGIEYGKGDVRHFAQGDAVDVPGLSNPTRELAQRDNLITQKLNEVVGAVNNREQFTPLPLVRTIVSPGDEIIASNYRIPPGFEARVLNATISSKPSTTDVELNVYYNEGFGGSAGVSVVTATPGAEFTGEVNFHQEGEFIISIKNKGALTLEVSVSLMLTMRPLGAVGTLLVGTVVTGKKGNPGQKGDPGPPGLPGSGGAGSPGMNWTGTWNFSTNYNPNDVVNYTTSMDALNAYICRVANTNAPPEGMPLDWDLVVMSGSQGPPGTPGTPGSSGGSTTLQGVASVVSGTYTPQGGYVPNVYTNNSAVYAGTVSSGVSYPALREVFYGSLGGSAGSPGGMAFLSGQFYSDFAGEVQVTLPKTAYGAKVDYLNTNILVVAVQNGTVPTDVVTAGTEISTLVVRSTGTDSFRVTVIGQCIPVALHVTGSQLVYN